ncbi:DUF1492 domain-containing protein [Anaeromicrobium sediminis]|uniref:RNA polymerase sigma-70 region 4 domain-containing protein n=1 Tax=Anaeromicrobium sediminis TaxID=1478221 RepID=A0A267MQR1_9FIRM|nr:DUF1492 domain-containing protein [Anaeromicrobium sediminis]PAB61113.1 hypothetical protein CCE28_01405 [Anaeromicrobium sediminis]
MDIAYRLKCYMEMKKETEEKLAEINATLEEMYEDGEQLGGLLKYWYIDKLDKDEIAEKMEYSRRNIYNLKEKAIRKFAIRIFDIKRFYITILFPHKGS